jgi:NAD(P)-dependent dehydrogenase (short-subunit alcohol dehydrogenase family)
VSRPAGDSPPGPGPDEPPLPAEVLGLAPGRARLIGRRILVVGAGTRPSSEPDPPPDNGRAIAVLAAREGARVVCCDRDEAAAAQTVAMIEAEDGWARVITADASDPEQGAAAVGVASAVLGGLDGLVLNVGIGLGRGLTGTSVQDWTRRSR